MKRVVTIILLAVLLCGCFEKPIKSPITSIPKLWIYQADSDIAVWVHGEDHWYTKINITINGMKVVSNNKTFTAEYKTNLTKFSLLVRVIDGEKFYTYECNVSLVDNTLTIEEDEDLIKVSDSVFKTVLEEEE